MFSLQYLGKRKETERRNEQWKEEKVRDNLLQMNSTWDPHSVPLVSLWMQCYGSIFFDPDINFGVKASSLLLSCLEGAFNVDKFH